MVHASILFCFERNSLEAEPASALCVDKHGYTSGCAYGTASFNTFCSDNKLNLNGANQLSSDGGTNGTVLPAAAVVLCRQRRGFSPLHALQRVHLPTRDMVTRTWQFVVGLSPSMMLTVYCHC